MDSEIPKKIQAGTESNIKRILNNINAKLFGILFCIPAVGAGVEYIQNGSLNYGTLGVELVAASIAGLLIRNFVLKEKKEDNDNDLEKIIYEIIFENNNFPMILIDRNTGEIKKMNDAAKRLYGKYEIEGMNITDINIYGDQVLEYLKNTSIRGDTYTTHHRFAGGEIREVAVHTSVVFGDLLFAMIHDTSENFDVLKSHPDKWIIFDPDTHKMIFSNDESLTRCDEEICFCRYYLNQSGCLVDKILENGQFCEEIVDEKKGFYKKVIGYKILDKNGKIRYVVINIIDITQRKSQEIQAQKALQTSELLIDAIPHPAVLINIEDRTIIKINSAGKKLRINESHYCYEAFQDGEIKCSFCKADEAMKSGEEQKQEIQLNGRYREVIWVQITNEVYLHYFIDISEKKKQEKLHEEEITLLRIMFAKLAHDIKNKLSGVVALTKIILDSLSDNKSIKKGIDGIEDVDEALECLKSLLEYLNSIREDGELLNHSVQGLKQIIMNILTQTSYEQGKIIINEEVFSIDELLIGAESCKSITKLKGISFRIYVDPALPEKIIGDKIAIDRIISNVLSNAIKNTIEGSVELFLRYVIIDGNPTMEISVKDTGYGIDPQNLEKIFTAFHQHDKKNGFDGSIGLGLTIVKEFVDLMGGYIEVKSEKGKGTDFIIRLPIKIAETQLEN